MDIVFVRHGRTEMNTKGLFSGHLDDVLSLEGKSDAKYNKEILKDKEFQSIYTSPLKRAVETSQILGYKAIEDSRLKEINFGIFEGLSYDEITRKYPIEAKLWSEDFINYKIPKGESFMELYERVADFLYEVSHKSENTLVVTHEGVIKCALCYIFEKPEYFYRFKISHTGITQICIDEE